MILQRYGTKLTILDRSNSVPATSRNSLGSMARANLSMWRHILSFEHMGPLKQPEMMLACTARSRLQEHDTSDHRSAIQNVSPQTIADPNKGCSYEVGRLCVKSRGDTPCQRQANRREQARAILGVAREGRGVKNVWADCGLREGRT